MSARQGSKKSIPHLWTGKGAVDCPVRPDRVGFMTDREVREVVSQDLFPLVLTDFTSQTRCHIKALCGSSRRGRRRRQRSGWDTSAGDPTDAAATSCRRLRVFEGEEGTREEGLFLEEQRLDQPTHN